MDQAGKMNKLPCFIIITQSYCHTCEIPGYTWSMSVCDEDNTTDNKMIQSYPCLKIEFLGMFDR